MSSLIDPEDLFKKIKELGQPAVGVSDLSTMAAAWDCLKYSKENQVKLIIGCEFNFVDDFSYQGRLRSLSLFAKNKIGYKNLLKLLKLANDNHIIAFKKVYPRLNWDLIAANSEGLICLTAGGEGICSQLINTRKVEAAKESAKKLKEIFGDNLGLEIQANNLRRNATPYNDYEDQGFVNRTLVQFGKELEIRVVATSEARMLVKEDYDGLDTISAMGLGQPVRSPARLKFTSDFYLKTREEVVSFFSRHFPTQAEEFCDNSLYFAGLCEEVPEWIDPKVDRPANVLWELPVFPVKDQEDYQEYLTWHQQNNLECPEDEGYLRYSCQKGFNERLDYLSEEDKIKYENRIKRELKVLIHKNLCSYMLIVADYLNWARKNDIPLGCGRGSCGSCAVAYCIYIHDADPIKYELVFERFYNMDRQLPSDIDCDVAKYGKPLIENYVKNKYGENNCANVTNYMTLTPKPYARSIARTFLYGDDRKAAVAVGNAIAEIIPKEIHLVEKALEEAPIFAEYAAQEKYHHLGKYAKQIGNKIVAKATHAAAIIISGKPLHEIVPVRRDIDNILSVEYEKERAEANGLIKMDILGLSTLDIIKETLELIKKRNKRLPKIPWNYDKNDKETYDLISSGNTFGVFQFGTSGGTIELCKKIKPKNIEDLAIINALTRPGVPKEARKEYIAVRDTGKPAKLLHPYLHRAFASTLGFPIFDECLLILAEDVAGWDLNETDRLRKFVKEKGKNPEKDKKVKKDFIEGSIQNKKLTKEVAERIWNEVVGNFGKYAFNKSHAITYSFITYQTAYLKAHYPLEFLVTNLSFECDSNTPDAENNIEQIKQEIRTTGVKIIPPDINKSEMTYAIIDDQIITTGFNSLKFIGKDSVPEILAKRPFSSLEDFLSKVDGRKVKAPAIQALAASGALDSFGMPRKLIYLYSHDYKKKLSAWLKKDHKPDDKFLYPFPEVEDWTIPEKSAMETKYLGETLCTDFRLIYPGFFANKPANFQKLKERYPETIGTKNIEIDSDQGQLQGIIKDLYEWKVKNKDSKIFNQSMAKIKVQDLYGNYCFITLFPDSLKHFKNRIKTLAGNKFKMEANCPISFTGTLNWYDGDLSITFRDLQRIAPAPIQPKDLKPQKVSMRISGKKKKIEEAEVEEIIEEIEDELIEEGLSDICDFDDIEFEEID